MRIYVALIALAFVFAGCKKSVDRAEVDEGIIKKYLEDHQITNAQRLSSGIYYIISKPGFGGHPAANSIVKVTYKGYLTDGTVFDKTNPGQPAILSLSNTISGWQIGVPLLQRGGSGTFFIPSGYGYGSQSTGDIPANSVLIFDINLIDFN